MAVKKNNTATSHESDIQSFIIEPINKECNLLGSYHAKHPTRNDQKVNFYLDHTGRTISLDRPPSRVFMRNISKINPYKFMADMSTSWGNEIYDFWYNHPQILVLGEESTKQVSNPIAVLIQKSKKTTIEFTNMTEKIQIINEVKSLSFELKKNLLYFLGGDAKDKTHADIAVELIGENLNGMVLQQKARFIRFMEANEKNKDYEVVFRKAKNLSIIGNVGGVWQTDEGMAIGASENDACQFFSNRPDAFEIIKERIAIAENNQTELDNIVVIGKIADERIKEERDRVLDKTPKSIY